MGIETETFAEMGVLARGAYGEAVLVRHCESGAMVVIKHVPMAGLSPSESSCALREVAALQLLRHPNVVRCHGGWVSSSSTDCDLRPWDPCSDASRFPIQHGLAESRLRSLRSMGAGDSDLDPLCFYSLNIVMEYVDGGSLDKLLTQNEGAPLDELLVGTWLAQIVLAVEHMHSKNILHRDIKPANIFISRSGFIKLGDLGSCKMLSSPGEMCASEHGTLMYLGPEVWRTQTCSHKSDMWSVGCVAHELMTLEAPFRPPDLAYKVLHEQAREPSGEYSEALRSVVRRMLRKNPAERPSAVEVLHMPAVSANIARWIRICSLVETTGRDREEPRMAGDETMSIAGDDIATTDSENSHFFRRMTELNEWHSYSSDATEYAA